MRTRTCSLLQRGLSLLLVCTALASASVAAGAGAPPALLASNPLMGPDMPDPDVLRVDGAGPDGAPLFVLTHTVFDGADFPIYTSTDLVHWELRSYAFGVPTRPGTALQVGDYFYCDTWAPEIRPAPTGGYQFTFTSSRHDTPQTPCPNYDEGSGVYTSWAPTPFGPFGGPDAHTTQPQPVAPSNDDAVCPPALRATLPFSHPLDHHDCAPAACNATIRLDADLFNDDATNSSWLSYAWYSNSEVQTSFDKVQLGEHVGLVRADRKDTRTVECSEQTRESMVWLASPHDDATLKALAQSCPRCGEQLSYTKGRMNQTTMRDGVVWGVVEAPMLFRRGEWIYALLSHSSFDSAYYAVYWVAARSIADLDWTLGAPNEQGASSRRLAGRLLIPSLQQSFGHGSAVLGPDDQHWYFVHHHLDHSTCNREDMWCTRDIYISPLEFEDRGDGLGDVWIRPIFPAENRTVPVFQRETSATRADTRREERERKRERMFEPISLF